MTRRPEKPGRPDLAITVLVCCSVAMAGLVAATWDWPRGSGDDGAGMAFFTLFMGILGSAPPVVAWLRRG